MVMEIFDAGFVDTIDKIGQEADGIPNFFGKVLHIARGYNSFKTMDDTSSVRLVTPVQIEELVEFATPLASSILEAEHSMTEEHMDGIFLEAGIILRRLHLAEKAKNDKALKYPAAILRYKPLDETTLDTCLADPNVYAELGMVVPEIYHWAEPKFGLLFVNFGIDLRYANRD